MSDDPGEDAPWSEQDPAAQLMELNTTRIYFGGMGLFTKEN